MKPIEILMKAIKGDRKLIPAETMIQQQKRNWWSSTNTERNSVKNYECKKSERVKMKNYERAGMCCEKQTSGGGLPQSMRYSQLPQHHQSTRCKSRCKVYIYIVCTPSSLKRVRESASRRMKSACVSIRQSAYVLILLNYKLGRLSF